MNYTLASAALNAMGQKLWAKYDIETLIKESINNISCTIEVILSTDDLIAFIAFANTLGYRETSRKNTSHTHRTCVFTFLPIME